MFSFDSADAKGKDVMDGMLKSYAELTRHLQAIATESAEFSKKICMDGVAHAEAISSVTSAEEAFELQASYLRSSYASGISELSRIAGMYADLAKIASRPFEAPLSRVASFRPAAVTRDAPAVNAA